MLAPVIEANGRFGRELRARKAGALGIGLINAGLITEIDLIVADPEIER